MMKEEEDAAIVARGAGAGGPFASISLHAADGLWAAMVAVGEDTLCF